ncbi:MAG: AbiV family abortive infection protein [Actinobacteria bacterium]|nr:AbiV family abortive infection protein [Actinomycetota bacterium]
MDKRESALRKIKRVATASFENAVRLHEDAILLYGEDRIPSALHTSVLSIEEIGKYFMHEDVWWHNRTDSQRPVHEMQRFLRGAYSHTKKQKWFASHADSPFISKPLLRVLREGELEAIKQKATYVGLPRKGNNIDFEGRMMNPSRISKRCAESYITLVNDYLVDLSVGVRKGCYVLDIPEIDDWLAEPEFEQHFRELWPMMRISTKRRIDQMLKYNDIER